MSRMVDIKVNDVEGTDDMHFNVTEVNPQHLSAQVANLCIRMFGHRLTEEEANAVIAGTPYSDRITSRFSIEVKLR